MKKGERTKRRIVERAAGLLYTKDHSGCSMNDVVRVTGVRKGGIYYHFASKDELALAAFDFAAGSVRECLRRAVEDRESAAEKLFAVMEVLGGLADDPPAAGGCLALNAAVEVGRGHLALKERAREVVAGWHRLVGGIIERGIVRGEFDPKADPYELAGVIIAMLEGVVVLGRLYDDSAHTRRAVDNLKAHVGFLTGSRGGSGGEDSGERRREENSSGREGDEPCGRACGR